MIKKKSAKADPFFVISRYNEDVTWIKEYSTNYIVYNKGKQDLPTYKSVKRPNSGGNQFDIFHFIYTNYNNLPSVMIFVQAYPFDHCKKEVFDKLITREWFTPLEYYGPKPANSYERRDYDGGFLEINNNWYIEAHNRTYKQKCKYKSLDEFMTMWYKNYTHVDWVRFSPGSQYLLEKQRALYYPRSFWKKLMDELPKHNMTEGHVIERALWMILQCNLEIRNEKKK